MDASAQLCEPLTAHLSGHVLLAKHLTEENVEDLIVAVAGKSQRELESFQACYAPRPDVAERIAVHASTESLPARALGGVSPKAMPAVGSRRIEPLSEDRFRVELTASRELRDKLDRARDLMRHRNPSGDLSEVVERAMDVLIERLEKERLGKTSRSQRTARRTKRGTIARAVRREVFERDGEQCTFRSEDGERCPARALLELDHIVSRAKGGSDDASNLRVR